MENLNRYIPREYLALKINYYRYQLNKIPIIKMHNFNSEGTEKKRIVVGKHKYRLNTVAGKKNYDLMIKQDEIRRQLQICETIWNCHFKDVPFCDCVPHKINRVINVAYDSQIVMDRDFFDKLENDSNTDYPKPKQYFFNGIYYRSAAERDIAIFYTEQGIPFKYEPKVLLAGLNRPIHPDFVIYIKELDTCIFHEHFGMKDSSDYLRTTKVKYGNYTNAGLIPELDILFTYDTEEMPFDIRYLSVKLNSAIFGKTLYRRPQS
jgi:hypothetical protein